MPFAPVKSSKWKKDPSFRRGARWLWPESVWKEIVEVAGEEGCLGPRTLAVTRHRQEIAL